MTGLLIVLLLVLIWLWEQPRWMEPTLQEYTSLTSIFGDPPLLRREPGGGAQWLKPENNPLYQMVHLGDKVENPITAEFKIQLLADCGTPLCGGIKAGDWESYTERADASAIKQQIHNLEVIPGLRYNPIKQLCRISAQTTDELLQKSVWATKVSQGKLISAPVRVEKIRDKLFAYNEKFCKK